MEKLMQKYNDILKKISATKKCWSLNLSPEEKFISILVNSAFSPDYIGDYSSKFDLEEIEPIVKRISNISGVGFCFLSFMIFFDKKVYSTSNKIVPVEDIDDFIYHLDLKKTVDHYVFIHSVRKYQENFFNIKQIIVKK